MRVCILCSTSLTRHSKKLLVSNCVTHNAVFFIFCWVLFPVFFYVPAPISASPFSVVLPVVFDVFQSIFNGIFFAAFLTLVKMTVSLLLVEFLKPKGMMAFNAFFQSNLYALLANSILPFILKF